MEGTALVPAQALTVVSTSLQFPLGTRIRTGKNEYIYLQGVASTAANDLVTFNSSYATARLVNTAVGPVAVAMAATVASTYGWYQIYGNGTANNGNVVSGDLPAFASSVTGAADDLVVTGDLIHGMIWNGTSSVTGAGVAVRLNYPYITQLAGAY